MKSSVFFPLFFSFVDPQQGAAFIFGGPKLVKNPSLVKYTEAQTGALLNLHLDVGNQDDFARMVVNGLQLELLQNAAKEEGRPKLPGTDGPHSTVSSGPRMIKVHQHGSFVSMQGLQYVTLENGCWELNWRDGASAGHLVCGFHLAETVKRHGSTTLPKGRIYFSFPIWSREELKTAQAEKARIETQARQYEREKNLHFAKSRHTSNLLWKALHYRNAAAVWEKHSLLNTKYAEMVPTDSEVTPIGGGELLLTTKGLLWSKEGSFHGQQQNRHTLLGTAIVKPEKGSAEPFGRRIRP